MTESDQMHGRRIDVRFTSLLRSTRNWSKQTGEPTIDLWKRGGRPRPMNRNHIAAGIMSVWTAGVNFLPEA